MVVTFLRLACSVVLCGGRNTANKYHWCVFTVIQPHWVCPRSQRVWFPSPLCLGSRLLCRELSEAGPGLFALPRSKLLRFRFLGTPLRCRLGWACILHPSQVRAAQVTRSLARVAALSWRLRLIPSPVPATCFSGCTTGAPSQVCCVSLLGSWSLAATLPADVDHPESQEVLVSNKVSLQFGMGCLPGAPIVPFRLWLPSPACLRWGMGWVHSQLALLSPLFCEHAWRWLGPFGGSQDSYSTVWVAISS